MKLSRPPSATVGGASLARLAGPDEPALVSSPPFRLDLAEERLWKGEQELRLRRKAFAILRHLAQNPRRLITHSELVEAVWGKNFAMSESLARTHVCDLRRVMGKEAIETVAGRGYRLVANVIHVEGSSLGRSLDEVRNAMPAAVVRVPGSAEAPRLELVRTRAPAPANSIRGTTLMLSSPRHARVLRQIADALDALGTTATAVLILGE